MPLSRHSACAILALLIGASAPLCAELEGPAFVGQHLTPAYRASVETVKTLAYADVVFLNGGLDQNFGEGMKCIIIRADVIIAEIILVKVDDSVSAGLILDLAPGYEIQHGDTARVKTISLAPTN